VKYSAAPKVCPKTGRLIYAGAGSRWLNWLFPVMGLASLVWFLIRVIPKPRRAAYPCQRVAAPMASTFILWMVAVVGSNRAYRKASQTRRTRPVLAVLMLLLAAIGAVYAFSRISLSQSLAQAPAPHGPLGHGVGIHPGRVVWVHDPDATSWGGSNWESGGNTDQSEVQKMLALSVRRVAGENTDSAAWDAIFRNFNTRQGRGNAAYQAGEKIAIKINLSCCNAHWTGCDASYNKSSGT